MILSAVSHEQRVPVPNQSYKIFYLDHLDLGIKPYLWGGWCLDTKLRPAEGPHEMQNCVRLILELL